MRHFAPRSDGRPETPDDFARYVATRLLKYARGIDRYFDDDSEVRELVRQVKRDQLRCEVSNDTARDVSECLETTRAFLLEAAAKVERMEKHFRMRVLADCHAEQPMLEAPSERIL